ncbi:tetraacyldisaccharide 4'-kinase [uncultured Victivallis sp.]|uniref:tetraacyldisaccharide 4'-kinase n=1 Tax=uncultured Victivallis sp. TaxID=354118 RepID=UPI0025D31ACA|nr:tetraacyldisaccharide 4'-kinase [uncultured Victivallis sp.]
MHSRFKFKGEDFEQYFLELMDGRRKAWYDRVMIDILFIASRFYRMAIQFRIWMYDKRVIRNHALGCLVVSIGNLSCGGTGKTPVVEVFARTLSEKGRKVAILSRGYRSKKRSFLFRLMQRFRSQKIELPPKVVSDGHNLLLESDYAGDEPFMLASNLSKVAVLVDKDRVKSGLYAVEQYQSDVIILDDGFQYLMLKPHINIVLVDSTDPFGNGNTLPRGILREPIKNIRRADYIFLTKSDGSHKINHLKNFLRRHTRRAEIIECCHKPKHLVKMFSGNQQEPLEKLRGAKVAALSAIAKPESFENFLRQLGAELVLKDHYADHHRYTQQEIIDFINQAKAAGADFIVTTEKDAVRIPKIGRCDVPLYYLRIEIDILSGQESFDQCISRICFL